MDYSPPDSSVRGILQARMLEWVAIPFLQRIFLTQKSNRVSCLAGELLTIRGTREARPSTLLLVRVSLC